jgi:hypothetical protein
MAVAPGWSCVVVMASHVGAVDHCASFAQAGQQKSCRSREASIAQTLEAWVAAVQSSHTCCMGVAGGCQPEWAGRTPERELACIRTMQRTCGLPKAAIA